MPQPPPQAENPAFSLTTIPSLPLPDDGPSRTQVSYLLLSVGLHEIASRLDGQFTAILLSWVPGLEFVHIKDLLLPASDEQSIIRTPICTPILLPHLTTLKVSDDGLVDVPPVGINLGCRSQKRTLWTEKARMAYFDLRDVPVLNRPVWRFVRP